MTLTGKLILGFAFAVVLQVVQLLLSAWFTTEVQRRAATVSEALDANIAVQRAIDAVRDLGERIASDLQADRPGSLAVYAVFVQELNAQVAHVCGAIEGRAADYEGAVSSAVQAIDARMQELRAARTRQEESDALAFLDDSLTDVTGALHAAQAELGRIGREEIAAERRMRDLPLQAGAAIAACGVLIMAAFVWWFSQQLVSPIQKAWAQLESRVAERTAELASTVRALEAEIVERQRAESQKAELHQQLVDASRQAGMAELANGVLHNVGNVLNTVNVATELIVDRLRKSRADGLVRAVGLLREHDHELARFLVESPQGQRLPGYLEQLGRHMTAEREALLREATELSAAVGHLKEIVSRQQSYARVTGTTTTARIGELVDDVLKMHAPSFARHDIRVDRQVFWDEPVEVDRSRVMQILLNLVRNAKQAVTAAGRVQGRITISIERAEHECVRVGVADDGVGIPEGDLTRVFAHGFTTKRDGHGFGLHHSANSATEMGGRLWAESPGPGAGARFYLELPISRPAEVPA